MRKTPVLLRRGPLSGRIEAITNYRHVTKNGRDMIHVVGDGKHDVSSDFLHLLLEELFPRAKECGLVTSAIDGAAKGMELNKRERAALRRFHNRLTEITERVS